MNVQIQKNRDTAQYQKWLDSLISGNGEAKDYITTYIDKYKKYKECDSNILLLIERALGAYKSANLDRNKKDYSDTYLMFYKILEKQLYIFTGLKNDHYKICEVIDKN